MNRIRLSAPEAELEHPQLPKFKCVVRQPTEVQKLVIMGALKSYRAHLNEFTGTEEDLNPMEAIAGRTAPIIKMVLVSVDLDGEKMIVNDDNRKAVVDALFAADLFVENATKIEVKGEQHGVSMPWPFWIIAEGLAKAFPPPDISPKESQPQSN